MSANKHQEKQGGEKEADEQREGGPRYHGAGWEKADQEPARPGDDTSGNLADADEKITDPGTRGAVFGKGGKGLAQRSGDEGVGPDKVPKS